MASPKSSPPPCVRAPVPASLPTLVLVGFFGFVCLFAYVQFLLKYGVVLLSSSVGMTNYCNQIVILSQLWRLKSETEALGRATLPPEALEEDLLASF